MSFACPWFGPGLVGLGRLQPVIDDTVRGALSGSGRKHLALCLIAALDVQARLRATRFAALAEEPEMGIHDGPREVLRHEIRGVLSSQDLPHLQLVEILLLLDPQGTDVDVP